MASFIGEYTSKTDAKGRITFPSGLVKQLPEEQTEKMVLKADIYKKCLILYSMDEWERQTALIQAKTNSFNPKHAVFIREFYKGTAEVKLDSNSRILIPAKLADYAQIEKEVYLFGQNRKIEIWAKEKYEKERLNAEDFAELAKEIMGGELPEL